MPQKELAKLAECSTSTIQAIELEKLKLSQKLAFKISQATGVDYAWLLKNDLGKPPINHNGQPYSEADLILAQDKDLRSLRYHELHPKLALDQAYYFLMRVLETQQSEKWVEIPFFLKRLEHFVRSEIGQFPSLRDEIDQEMQEWWKANVTTGKSYPKSFLTPLDTRAFDMMKLNGDEGKQAFEEYQRRLAKLGPVIRKTPPLVTQSRPG